MSSATFLPNNKIWSTSDLFILKTTRVIFFETQCIIIIYYLTQSV